MRLSYDPETDALYIDLVDRPGVATEEVSDGVLVDYDASGAVVGIDIDHVGKKVDLTKLVISNLPTPIKDTSR